MLWIGRGGEEGVQAQTLDAKWADVPLRVCCGLSGLGFDGTVFLL